MASKQREFGLLLSGHREKHGQLSNEARAAIVAAVNQGQSQAGAAADFGVSRQSVSRIMQKFNTTGEFKVSPRSGRPKKLTSRNIRALKRTVLQGANITNKDLVTSIPVSIGLATVKRSLAREGLFKVDSKKKISKPKGSVGKKISLVPK